MLQSGINVNNKNRTGFRDKFVEEVYFMDSSLDDGYERRDISLQISIEGGLVTCQTCHDPH